MRRFERLFLISAALLLGAQTRVDPTQVQQQFGWGFVKVNNEIQLDTAYITYRGYAPVTPGPCTPQGTGAWAVTSGGTAEQYLYICTADPDNQGFHWARVGPLVSSW